VSKIIIFFLLKIPCYHQFLSFNSIITVINEKKFLENGMRKKEKLKNKTRLVI
jgi:hypothetical protein